MRSSADNRCRSSCEADSAFPSLSARFARISLRPAPQDRWPCDFSTRAREHVPAAHLRPCPAISAQNCHRAVLVPATPDRSGEALGWLPLALEKDPQTAALLPARASPAPQLAARSQILARIPSSRLFRSI